MGDSLRACRVTELDSSSDLRISELGMASGLSLVPSSFLQPRLPFRKPEEREMSQTEIMVAEHPTLSESNCQKAVTYPVRIRLHPVRAFSLEKPFGISAAAGVESAAGVVIWRKADAQQQLRETAIGADWLPHRIDP